MKKIIGVDNTDLNCLDSVIISLLFQLHEYSWLFMFNPDAFILGADNCGKSCIGFCMSEKLSPLVHGYSWLFMLIYEGLGGGFWNSLISKNLAHYSLSLKFLLIL